MNDLILKLGEEQDTLLIAISALIFLVIVGSIIYFLCHKFKIAEERDYKLLLSIGVSAILLSVLTLIFELSFKNIKKDYSLTHNMIEDVKIIKVGEKEYPIENLTIAENIEKFPLRRTLNFSAQYFNIDVYLTQKLEDRDLTSCEFVLSLRTTTAEIFEGKFFLDRMRTGICEVNKKNKSITLN